MSECSISPYEALVGLRADRGFYVLKVLIGKNFTKTQQVVFITTYRSPSIYLLGLFFYESVKLGVLARGL